VKFLPAFLGKGALLKHLGHQPDIVEYTGKGIVYFMNDAGRQPAQRYHFILMEYAGLVFDFTLQGSYFSKIPEKADETDAVLSVYYPRGGNFNRNTGAARSGKESFVQHQFVAAPEFF